MKIVEIHDYIFPSHLLAPLVNGDPVDEEDRESFEAFLDKLERYKNEYGASHYTIDYESDSYFSHTNCLFNLGCDITDIKIHFFR